MPVDLIAQYATTQITVTRDGTDLATLREVQEVNGGAATETILASGGRVDKVFFDHCDLVYKVSDVITLTGQKLGGAGYSTPLGLTVWYVTSITSQPSRTLPYQVIGVSATRNG